MSEPKHTPEPWSRVDGYVIEAETPKGMTAVVCNTRNDTIPYKECRANAERIVACVNACAGIEDPGKLDVRAARAQIEAIYVESALDDAFDTDDVWTVFQNIYALLGGASDARAAHDALEDMAAAAREEDLEPSDACTEPTGHEFEHVEDERFMDGRMVCIHCGADGDQ